MLRAIGALCFSCFLDLSSLGREAMLLPAAEMASALAFHVVQCLFGFISVLLLERLLETACI